MKLITLLPVAPVEIGVTSPVLTPRTLSQALCGRVGVLPRFEPARDIPYFFGEDISVMTSLSLLQAARGRVGVLPRFDIVRNSPYYSEKRNIEMDDIVC